MERIGERGCHSKTRMSNKNSTSSLGITSSYLYKVSTKSSHVNLGKYLWSTPTPCHSHVNCLPVVCLCVFITQTFPCQLSIINIFPRGVATNSHGCLSMTAAVSWCQKACPRQIITRRSMCLYVSVPDLFLGMWERVYQRLWEGVLCHLVP